MQTPIPGASAPPGWEFLLTPDGRAALASVAVRRSAGAASETVGSELRRQGFTGEQVAALLTQAQLRRTAEKKFGVLAEKLLFTRAGLEQATRLTVAALHAGRFTAAGCRRVADLGCGIGAESIALLSAGIDACAVEIDPFTARIAEYNLRTAAAGTGKAAPPVATADAQSWIREPHAEVDGVFLDPARRTAGHHDTRRLSSPEDYSPSLTFAFSLAKQFPTGVKLGPGFDRSLIPDEAEAQWISSEGQVVETGLWFGPLARPGVKRSALVLHRGQVGELTAAEDATDADARPLGEFMYEPDGAVIRARLIGRLAEGLGAGMVSDGIAYLTSDRLTPTPFASAFRIIEELPAREKLLRRELSARGIGTLEIKKRGADIDPAALRKRLKLRGERSATLFLTRVCGRHTALLAEPCRST